LLAEVRAGHGDAAFPAADGKSVGANLACHIFLRPALALTCPLELKIGRNLGRLFHEDSPLKLLIGLL
jgi:hypothetical protein